tara:strand:+ start:272 stop:1009 length:738 start_codon:yes stop_codon:yes gene_type:complete
MNIGLVIGKDKSTGVPGKNIKPILGRPAAEYAFIAAKHSIIDKIYVSTDSEFISSIGKKYDSICIDRPKSLAQPDSLTEDVITHAYDIINLDTNEEKIDSISLLFCNNPAIDVNLLNQAIRFLNSQSEFDSCFSVAKYDMFSPARARKLLKDDEIKPFVSLDALDNVSSIRDSQGSVFFCDLSIQVMKKRCINDIENGDLPFKWQGKKSKAIITDFGFDIDSEWQEIVIEYWLKKRGFTNKIIPW